MLPAATVPAHTGAVDAEQVLELPLRQAANKPWRFRVTELAPDGTTVEGGFVSLTLTQHEDQS